jgi:dihydrofolate reductase
LDRIVGELVADLFISLDGFAGGEDVGPFFGYGGPELDRWIGEHMAEPQEVVLGRRTYEALASISAGATDQASRRLTEVPKLVVSRTLREPLAWANTRLLAGDGCEALAAVKAASPLTVFPLILGPRGREPAFAGMPTERLHLDTTQVLDGRILSLEYQLDAGGR